MPYAKIKWQWSIGLLYLFGFAIRDLQVLYLVCTHDTHHTHTPRLELEWSMKWYEPIWLAKECNMCNYVLCVTYLGWKGAV